MMWPLVPLPTICHPKQWPTIRKADLLEVGYPVYGANGRIGFYSEFNHAEATILIGCRGTCGAVNVCEPKSYVTGNAMALDALDRSQADLRFVFRALEAADFHAVITGVAQPQITRRSLTRLQIPLPPLAEQKRIAAILDAADGLRAKRREALAQLDTLLQSTFLDMFGDPRANPRGWDARPLDSFCRPKQWPTIKKSEMVDVGYPVFGANGRIGFYSEYNHSEPTILITCRGATCGTINVCDPRSYVTGNSMALDDLDESQVKLRFLKHALEATDFSSVITGVAQPQITRQSLKRLSVLVPPQELQDRFIAIAESVERQRGAQVTHLTELDTLFASLQQRAFRGDL